MNLPNIDEEVFTISTVTMLICSDTFFLPSISMKDSSSLFKILLEQKTPQRKLFFFGKYNRRTSKG